jgi:hypothetical protein
MDNIDYSELRMLIKGAEKAIMSGTLNDWQHANTSTFHILASAVVDLHDRLARLEVTPDKPILIS